MKDYFLRKCFPDYREGTAWRLRAAIDSFWRSAYAGEERCVDSGASRAPILGPAAEPRILVEAG
jgi:hypothetical protein